MPEKKKRDMGGDIDNLKSRKLLRQPTAEPWAPRFWAWLIDMVIVAAAIEIIFPSALITLDIYRAFVSFMAILLYWSVFDSNGRQSVGKKVMDLKLVDEQGNSPSFSKAFVNAVGKSLLLPIDVAIGALSRPGEKRRLFSMASDTYVVSVNSSSFS